MDTQQTIHDAVTIPTKFIETNGRRIAYRDIGSRTAIPIILCIRFRGVMDSWDPAFLDALATRYRVITFDYTGLGQSTGEPSYVRTRMAQDVIDLADGLKLDTFVIGGWSIGGLAAQAAAKIYAGRISAMVLIGTVPPGKVRMGIQPLFFERALKPHYDRDDEIVLFFHPPSTRSRAAAEASFKRIDARTLDRSPGVDIDTALKMLAETRGEDTFVDDNGYRDFLKTTSLPILVISGTHEIVFPMENWFDLVVETPSVQLHILPQMGHGPQQEAPQLCADLIDSFLRNA